MFVFPRIIVFNVHVTIFGIFDSRRKAVEDKSDQINGLTKSNFIPKITKYQYFSILGSILKTGISFNMDLNMA